MTDGNTALPVSPVSEEDMFKLSQIFARMANAVVNETALAKQVAELSAKVESLTHEVETKRLHAEALDQTITELRQAKSALEYDKRDLEHKVSAMQGQATLDASTIEDHETQIRRLTDELERTWKERDDHGFHAMQLEDDLKTTQAKLSEFRDKLGGLHALLATPVAVHPEPAPTPPAPEPVPQPSAPTPEPEPKAMPEAPAVQDPWWVGR